MRQRVIKQVGEVFNAIKQVAQKHGDKIPGKASDYEGYIAIFFKKDGGTHLLGLGKVNYGEAIQHILCMACERAFERAREQAGE